jgi:hypothetical protein
MALLLNLPETDADCLMPLISVDDSIEDETCLHEAGQSEISSIRKSALGSFRDLAGDRGPHEQQS